MKRRLPHVVRGTAPALPTALLAAPATAALTLNTDTVTDTRTRPEEGAR
ncbi:hypothetical protein [Streptomyces sp. NPDC052042]